MIDRRFFLAAAGAGCAAVLGGRAGWADAGGLAFGPRRAFSEAALRARARALAAAPYRPAPSPAAALLRSLDYDAVQKIRYRADRALWARGPAAYPVQFFHLHRYAVQPVRIHAVSGGTAREVLYRAGNFDYGQAGKGRAGLAAKLPADLGYAGFRVMSGRRAVTDWLAFQGASYFRAAGDEGQYGASARGIAIDSGLSSPEEFPRFTEFWLSETTGSKGRGGPVVTIHALLDGPSVAGLYRFDVVRQGGQQGDAQGGAQSGGQVMDVRAELFFRNPVGRLGVAPLTSMYWFGENDRGQATDWRPEIHDSDGLALWTGRGERIWRPLINPPRAQTNSFLDLDPKGFGLFQRDRSFENYQDDGAFYEKRPGIWVEPKEDPTGHKWGAGAVQLVELPTDDEIHDNIVAFWHPKEPVAKGASRRFDYRLWWQGREPFLPTTVGHVIATRIGRGGVPGQPRPPGQSKFAIDFAGGPFARMAQRFDVKPVVTVSRGEIKNPYALKVVGTKDRWRAIFDVKADGAAPVDMRCFLRLGDRTLTETWLYQLFPVG